MTFTRPRFSISNEQLDRIESNNSARYSKTKKGALVEDGGFVYEVVDKIVFPINHCPHCHGSSTWHAWIQSHGDILDNVWMYVRKIEENGRSVMKIDYCFDCQKEFVIEMFLMRRYAPPTPEPLSVEPEVQDATAKEE